MPQLLSEAQVEGYARDGYVSPIDVLNQVEVKAFRQELEDWEKQRGQAIDFPEKSKSYLLFNWADQLVHHPSILDAVEDVIGPDILVYHSTLFLKEATRRRRRDGRRVRIPDRARERRGGEGRRPAGRGR